MTDDDSPKLPVVRFVGKDGHVFDMFIAEHGEVPGAFVGELRLFIYSTPSGYQIVRDGIVVKDGEIDFSYWDRGAVRPTLEQIAAIYYPGALIEVVPSSP